MNIILSKYLVLTAKLRSKLYFSFWMRLGTSDLCLSEEARRDSIRYPPFLQKFVKTRNMVGEFVNRLPWLEGPPGPFAEVRAARQQNDINSSETPDRVIELKVSKIHNATN